MKKIILAYIPVLHQGYWKFFKKYPEVKIIYLFGQELINSFRPLIKDIRALSPGQAKQAIKGWGGFDSIRIANIENLENIRSTGLTIIMPDEDECHAVAREYLKGCSVEFDNSIFLRWDKTKSLAVSKVNYDRIISTDGMEKEMMDQAIKESIRATNQWRQTGALIVRDGQVILVGYNRQVPSSHTPYFEGDARSFFSRGIHIELTTDQHAEAHLISEAARRGIALGGTDLFITTFPCPPCAKLIAYSGIKRCYFNSGYAMLDGERILRDKKIEIILVK